MDIVFIVLRNLYSWGSSGEALITLRLLSQVYIYLRENSKITGIECVTSKPVWWGWG